MKILGSGIQIGKGNKGEQGLRRWTDERGIDHIETAIALELLTRSGIKDLYRAAIFIGCRRKISGSFGESWHGRKRVIGGAATITVPAGKEKSFVAAVENFGNVQRTAKKRAE